RNATAFGIRPKERMALALEKFHFHNLPAVQSRKLGTPYTLNRGINFRKWNAVLHAHVNLTCAAPRLSRIRIPPRAIVDNIAAKTMGRLHRCFEALQPDSV